MRRLAPGQRREAIQLLPVLGVLLLVSVLLDPGGAPHGDEGPIVAAAHRLLHGDYAIPGTMDATRLLWHGPGLPAVLAPVIALGLPLSLLRLTSPLLMFAAALLFYRLLRLRLSRRWALAGAYALGLYAPAYYVIGTVSKEPLALLLSVAALYGTARYLNGGRRPHAALAGLSLAALAMTRLEYGWVITAGLVISLGWWLLTLTRRPRRPVRVGNSRRLVVVCAVAMAACLPWLAYSYTISHRPLYWGNSGGISLYWMSSPGPGQLGQWHAPHTVLANPTLTAYRPFFHSLASLRPVQRDLELQRVALKQAVAHPAKFGLNILANLGRMFVGFPFSFTLPLAVIAGLVLVNGGLLAGLIAALARLRRRRVALPAEAVPFILFAALALFVHVLPTAEPRMVIPFIPVPIWLVAQAFGRRRASLRRLVPRQASHAVARQAA